MPASFIEKKLRKIVQSFIAVVENVTFRTKRGSEQLLSQLVIRVI